MPEVSLYRLLPGHQLEDYVNSTVLGEPKDRRADPERVLWRATVDALKPPAWSPLITDAFLDQTFPDRSRHEVAVIVLRLTIDGHSATWGVVFGQGAWHWLFDVDRDAPAIAAAQLLYDKSSGMLTGLKKIVAGEIRVQAGTITRQLTDNAPLSAFDFDEFGQSFLSLTAKSPKDTLGKSFSAGNSIHLTAIPDWNALVKAVEVLEIAVQDGRAGNVRLPGLVRENIVPTGVQHSLIDAIRAANTSVGIALGNDDRARPLALNLNTAATHGAEDYSISDLQADLRSSGKLDTFDWDDLGKFTLADPAELAAPGSILLSDVLMASIPEGDDVWALADGQWWRAPKTWIARIDQTISKIKFFHEYPDLDRATYTDKEGKVQEGLYNSALAPKLPLSAVLDKKIFRAVGMYSGIEVADILSVKNLSPNAPTILDVIAVKRGLRESSSLAHLFSQVAAASGALTDDSARSAFIQNVIRRHLADGPARNAILEILEAKPFDPSRVRFVLAIAGEWKNQLPQQAIPVIAKSAVEPLLRRLRAGGYQVAIAKINEVPGSRP